MRRFSSGSATEPTTVHPLPGADTGTDGATNFPLRGLVRCGYCNQPMDPGSDASGCRSYRCVEPCGRSQVDAGTLEAMAVLTLFNAMPGLTEVASEVGRAALCQEMYRRIVVHDDLTDVRFFGHPI